MRKNPTKSIEDGRVTDGPLASSREYGANGAFIVTYRGVELKIIVSDGSGWARGGLPGQPWEYVSVSLNSPCPQDRYPQTRCPTWEEMDAVKRIFWRDDETVMQLHVPRDQHVNEGEVLHLWKPVSVKIPLPPTDCVGHVGAG